jgi:acyl transferase domain-containing protein/phosphopantetheinyl transferase
MKTNSDIAIVGLSCIFPGAGDAETFWRNIRNKSDAIRMAPEERMDAVFFDEGKADVDRFYCRRGGFIDEFAAFDPTLFGILPVSVAGTEPEHLLTLRLAHDALKDAGVWERALALDKAGIIIGKGNYAGPGATRAIEIIRTGQQLVQVLQDLMPGLSGKETDRVKKEFQLKKGRFAADTAMGLIPNLVASLVSNRLDLGGPAYTVDAACASSLVAIDHAIKELLTGSCDLVIAGGVHACQNAPFWSIFTQLGALSRSQQIRPFDRKADGLLIGEGCGFVVLKRLEDALRDEHRIYAVIKGVGVSSDGAGNSVMSPSVKGQSKAIIRAWENAGIDPQQVGYIEAHGTGTPVGDRIEMETLSAVFGAGIGLPKAGIGSVKSNIGHAMPAAGIAGVIKTALALYYKELPPTLHCEEPLAAMKDSRFEPVREVMDWGASGLPLRAGVNAFGFGGINAHVVMERWGGGLRPVRGGLAVRRASEAQAAVAAVGVAVVASEIQAASEGMVRGAAATATAAAELDRPVVLARESGSALIQALENKEVDPGKGDYRIVLFDPVEERIEKAIKIIKRGMPWRNRQDIWFTNEPLISRGGKVAFVFPGLDGLAGGEVDSVGKYFGMPVMGGVRGDGDGEGMEGSGLARAGGDADAGACAGDGSAVDNVLGAALKLTERSRVLDTALKRLGVKPDLNAGHSVGEWLAGRSAGWVSEETVTRLLSQLDNQSFDIKETGFLVVGCGYERLAFVMGGIRDLYLSNDNCPQQVILCGTDKALEEITVWLREMQIFHQVLPFRSGFHSPFLKDRLDLLLDNMRGIRFQKAKIPLWSATTLEVYPESEEAIRELSVQHLLEPVRWRQLTERLYREGVRVFVQVGSGGLTGFIDDTLKGEKYSAVAANLAVRPGLNQLQRVLAALFAEGAEVDLDFLGVRRADSSFCGTPMRPAETAVRSAGTAVRPAGAAASASMKLQLGSPLISGMDSLRELAERRVVEVETGGDVGPVERAFLDNVAAMSAVQTEILSLFRKREAAITRMGVEVEVRMGSGGGAEAGTAVGPEVRAPFVHRLDVSLDSHPYLIDHALVRQRPGWREVKDMDPVIPMTMMLELFGGIAECQAPRKVLQKMRNIKIFQWMNVATPFRETVRGQWQTDDQLFLDLDKFASAEMILASGYAPADEEVVSIGAGWTTGMPSPADLKPDRIYEQHMFHGPAYQGIREVTAFGEDGIAGIIEGSTGMGSLLDNAGQLFGLWLQFILEKDRIAFPVKIREIEFYGDRKSQEGRFECVCRLTGLNEGFATADFVLKKEGRVWAVIRGWQNRRLEIDQQFWKVAMSPLHNFLSVEIEPGIFMFHNAYSRVVSWDLVFKRYFSGRERDTFPSMTPGRKKEWTISRIAAKDAVRALLLRLKKEAYYPVEFEIRSDEKGRPFPYGPGMSSICLSLAHKGTDAVAIAAYGSPVGIDIERIEERDAAFIAAVVHPEELALGGAGQGGAVGMGRPGGGDAAQGGAIDQAEWVTRCWVAKEAYGKYLGLGLQGNPAAYRIEEARDGILRIRDIVIKTIKYQNYIIGWTL